LKTNTKGILLALATAFAVSNVYIFSKSALNEVHLAQFGTLWFGLGIIWNLIFILGTKKYKKIIFLEKRHWAILSLIATLEMFGTIFFFLSVNSVENPATVSFLANINPLLIATLGFVVLKERFNFLEGIGMLVTLIGAFIISYKGGGINNFFIEGSQYVFISGIIYAFSTVTAKRNIKNLDPSFLALARIVFLFTASVLALIYFGLNLDIPSSALINIGIGSVLGPFLTGTLGYFTLKHIDASKASMIGTSRSLFVLLGAFVIFDKMPASIQLIGGGFTILGVIFISSGKLKNKTNG
jgi:drug/metabolite transporter (DMT)-like permease